MKLTRLAGAALALTAGLWPPAAPAHATVAPISPGDRIDIDSDFCTLGYTTAAGHRSFAITAGHCQTTPGQRVRDRRSGALGVFVRAVVEPPHTGGADYGLIDFGPAPAAAPPSGSPPLVARPHPGHIVCRSGITTATQCGTILSAYGPDQYLTTGTTPSQGGDSGGPVWVPGTGSPAAVIGIWLGGYTTLTGAHYGRFGCLTDAFEALGLRG